MQVFLAVISILLILTVILSLIRSDFWIFKVFEYPRLQKLFIILAVLVGWWFFWPSTIFYKIVAGGLLVSTFYLIYKVWPYTYFAKKEMKKVPRGNSSNEFKVFAANVLQDNKEYERLLNQIREHDPDIVFLLETNKEWDDALKVLADTYPYHILSPLENTYGLLFYSRLELTKQQLCFIVKDDIPSIDVTFLLPSGREVRAWGLHPEPPVPGENLYSTAKDKELMKVALTIRDCELPCLVFGDLNDVAWSHTTELFRKTSSLLDPRRGRGFYSTFSAHSWFVRFPLDYIFCSKHFGLVDIKRLPKNGSDHFATLTHLCLTSEPIDNEPPKADKEELAEAKDMAAQQVNDEK